MRMVNIFSANCNAHSAKNILKLRHVQSPAVEMVVKVIFEVYCKGHVYCVRS